MISTPLLTKVNTNGGTLYTFTSASKDLTRILTNNVEYDFKFSKFVCLNLPPIKQGDTSTMNFNQFVDDRTFENITARLENGDLIITVKVVDTLYRYVESCVVKYGETRLECKDDGVSFSVMIMDEELDFTSVSFLFTIELEVNEETEDGSLTLIETDELAYNYNSVGNGTEKGMYLEELKYDPINKDPNVWIAEHFQNYILNFESVLLNQETYDPNVLKSTSERIFFKWLRQIGAIRFKNSSSSDKYGKTLYEEDVESYYEKYDVYQDRTVQYIGDIDVTNQVEVFGDSFGEIFLYIPGRHGASEKVLFRKITDVNYGLTVYTEGSEKIKGREDWDKNVINEIGLDAIYDHDVADTNYYYGDEGYSIDFTEENYPYGSIRSMNSHSFINFEFNCVLIYYDLIKKTNGQKSYARNLYGVLFLDNFTGDERSSTDASIGYAQSYPKIRSSEIDEGNAYALKLVMKVDTAPSTTLRENDDNRNLYNNTHNEEDMALYTEAMVQLQKCIDIFYTQQNEIYRLQDRIDELESLVLTLNDTEKMQSEIDEIKNRLDGNSIVDTASMVDMINVNSRALNRIIHGKYPTKLALDSSRFNTGNGLSLVKSIDDDSVTIKNTLQKYNFGGKLSLRPLDGNVKEETGCIHVIDNVLDLQLNENSNLYLLSENEGNKSESSSYEDLVINLEAYDNEWSVGQSVKFIITDEFKMNLVKQKSIRFMTTTYGVSQEGDGDLTLVQKDIKNLSKLEMANMSNKTEIEFVCIDNDLSTDGEKFITIIK